MEKSWTGLPYQPISSHYLEYFGEKIYKIPVSVSESCPNREGIRGMQTCSFCDVWGSAARTEASHLDVVGQINQYLPLVQKRFKAQKFLVYFQAYTSTFQSIQKLRAQLEQALLLPNIVGVVIGTRADCISQSTLDLWNELSEKTYVSIELGVQSFFDDDLEFYRRGHPSSTNLSAIHKLSSLPNIHLSVHLILGSPYEDGARIIHSAETLNQLPVHSVKLHNLHVLKNTHLEKLYRDGSFQPISRSLYANRMMLFLENLSPRFYIHRLAAYASRWDELVAPDWTADKMGTHQYLIDQMRESGSFQSKSYVPQIKSEILLREVLQHRSISKPFHSPVPN